METTSSTGGRIRALRKARGLKQQELADAAGVSMQTVSNLERDRHRPDLDTLIKVSRALGVGIGDLT